MQAVLIENPKAGGVSAASVRVAERALAATFDLELVTTSQRGHATELAREAVEAGAKTVIAYGGDGTVNEIVNGLLAGGDTSRAALAVLPGGTTNVLARNLGYPSDLVEATDRLIETVERGQPRLLDIGRISALSGGQSIRRDFVFATGVVLDADIVRRVESSKRGRVVRAFVYHGLKSFFAVRKEGRPQLLLDTPSGIQEVYWACIATQDPYTYVRSRPLRVLPRDADHPGTPLHLLASRQARFWPTLRWLAQALTTAKHVGHRQAIHLTDSEELSLRAHRPVHLQADGEYVGEVDAMRVTPLTAALPVWA